jgi:hypothetical protein
VRQKTVLFCGPIDSPLNSGRYMISGLEQIGYRVIGYDYRTHKNYRDDLATIVHIEKPEYVFVLKGEALSPELIRKFKQAGCITILWITMIAPEDYVASLIREYNFIITNVDFYVDYFKRRGVKYIKWIHQGFAPNFFDMQGPVLQSTENHYADVAMIGSMGDRIYRKRCELIIKLRKDDIDVKWWGPKLARQWRNLRYYWAGVHHAWMGKEVYMKEFADVIRNTKIYLGQDADVVVPGKYLSNRVFAVLGCGGFYLGRRTPGISSVFEVGKELEVFDSEDELTEKIHFYLKNEEKRKQIAVEGQKKVINNFSYGHQMKKIFEWINKQS